MNAANLRIKIFADGADISGIQALRANPLVQGFTTNPTLMRQAGVRNYVEFAKQAIEIVDGMPISLEVFSDEFVEMKVQAIKLSQLGHNVNVKIPITNSHGVSSLGLVKELASEGVSLNVTALFTRSQVEATVEALRSGTNSYISIFAGRVADTGVDPLPIMVSALEMIARLPEIQLIWASPREVFNVVQANQIGCNVITVTHELLKKLSSLGKDLEQFSLETVKMFSNDAASAKYTI
jgi:transaldolase